MAERASLKQYLIVDELGKGHLPVRDTPEGPLNHHLMGAAWAALHGGYRGNRYEGSGKAVAIARLKALYQAEGMELPDGQRPDGQMGRSASGEDAKFQIQDSRIAIANRPSTIGNPAGPRFVMTLSETLGEGLIRIPIAVTGTWKGAEKEFSIGLDDLKEIRNNFAKKPTREINVDYEHASEVPFGTGGPVLSAGRIVELDEPERFESGSGQVSRSADGQVEGKPSAYLPRPSSAHLPTSRSAHLPTSPSADLHTRPSAPLPTHPPLMKLDYAVNAALTLAHVAQHSGDSTGLLAYGRKLQSYLPCARSPEHLRRLLEQLAVVSGEAVEADHALAADSLLARHRRRSLVVWLTDLAETAATPDVIEAASRLLSRHLVLFAVVGQPELHALLATRPESPAQMYQYVAAQQVIQRRELLLRRMREQGALAMEFLPGRLSPEIVNHYLQIKWKGLL